jgi:hypothetical protein
MRDRNVSVSPDQRYDTLAYMQRPANPDNDPPRALSVRQVAPAARS